MNKKASERIPTLTDIVKTGDPDMENHFDGHFVEDLKHNDEPETAPAEFNQQTIDEIINQVIDTSMPVIERQLRNQLTGILKKYTKNNVDR